MDELRFYRLEEPLGWLSNFSPHGFELDGQWWHTVEHRFQGMKFTGRERREEVRLARSPTEAKRLGRRHGVRPNWDGLRDVVMLEALRAKFAAHEDLRRMLLETGDAILVEDSPRDRYWGCGADGRGKNRLGALLMQVRDELRAGG